MTSSRTKNEVVSLYDLTGIACMPWAERGYTCYCYDILHPVGELQDGSIVKRHADLHDRSTLDRIVAEHAGKVAFVSAFPVCTDLAVSGAPHWAQKRENDPSFQERAVGHVLGCNDVAMRLGAPFYIENPIGAISTLWRKPDYIFDPYEFGGYIPQSEATHPTFPEYIPSRDAYTKRTCLWVGNEFAMPQKMPVEPTFIVYNGKRFSPQHGKLGGTSRKTKNIRSATPRGFARAVCMANHDLTNARPVEGGVG